MWPISNQVHILIVIISCCGIVSNMSVGMPVRVHPITCHEGTEGE